jgi:precorrin-6A/cobalt-precorrin-6A reductase
VSQRDSIGLVIIGLFLEHTDKAMLRVLILGGTTQANALAVRLARDPQYDPILSLAGRTKTPVLPDVRHRIGGFGGVNGLIDYLRHEAIDVLIDATHPFAEQISAHAIAAARETAVRLAVLTRPAWTPQPGDHWHEFPDAARLAHALGDAPRRVFLTIGRRRLGAFETAPQHDYLIRTIERPEPAPRLPHQKLLLARGPFTFEDEVKLMREARIEVLVTKNSGGAATLAKLDAARTLGIEVFVINRPQSADVPTLETLDALVEFLETLNHRAAP